MIMSIRFVSSSLHSTMRDDPTVVTFIKLVEEHPCLWNYGSKDYNKREATDSAWRAIASEVGDTDVNCRDRWKNVRCSFVRSHNSTKAKSRYYLAGHLAFLLPFMKGKFGSDNQSIKCDDEKEDEVLTDSAETSLDKPEEINSECALTEQHMSDNDTDQGDRSISTPSPQLVISERIPRKRRFTKLSTSKNNVVDSDFKRSDVTSYCTDEDDVDLLFFKSMMTDIKKLPDKQKRVFKRKVMMLLEDLLD